MKETREEREARIRRALRGRHGPNVVSPVQRKTVISETETALAVLSTGETITRIVTLKTAGSDERRAFRRECARLMLSEKTVETVLDTRGNEIPRALEITGLETNVREAISLPIVAFWNYPLDTPVFLTGRGESSGESEKCQRAIRRRTMNKFEREARYSRESAEYRREVREDDKRTMARGANVNGAAAETEFKTACERVKQRKRKADWDKARFMKDRDSLCSAFGMPQEIAAAIVRRLRRLKK